jgi:hypothetical protein
LALYHEAACFVLRPTHVPDAFQNPTSVLLSATNLMSVQAALSCKPLLSALLLAVLQIQKPLKFSKAGAVKVG